jgi:hypothetical protein
MKITRRHLLALTAATSAVGAIGIGGLALQWWDQPANAPYKVLSTEEAAFIRAWGGCAFPSTTSIPLSTEEARLDRFFDSFSTVMPTDAARLLRLLLHALNAASLPTHGGYFVGLDVHTQMNIFESWTHTEISEFRSATQSLTLLLGMGWSIHPTVAPFMQKMHSCGYGV